jgi:hypothetical protein
MHGWPPMIEMGTRVRVVKFGPLTIIDGSKFIGLTGTVVDFHPLGGTGSLYEIALDEDPEPELQDTLPCYEEEIEVLNA